MQKSCGKAQKDLMSKSISELNKLCKQSKDVGTCDAAKRLKVKMRELTGKK